MYKELLRIIEISPVNYILIRVGADVVAPRLGHAPQDARRLLVVPRHDFTYVPEYIPVLLLPIPGSIDSTRKRSSSMI